jgi:hypothetical protein
MADYNLWFGVFMVQPVLAALMNVVAAYMRRSYTEAIRFGCPWPSRAMLWPV